MNQEVISFNSGLITPQSDCRTDVEKVKGGCRILQNMIPEIYGDVARRPGMEFIIKSSTYACYYVTPTPDPAKTQIYTAAQLQAINDDLDGDYELMNNIDLAGVAWIPIGSDNPEVPDNSPFTGTFEGNYFTISNLTCNRAYYCGLFGKTQGSAEIKHVILEDVVLHGNNYVGALVGWCEDTDLTYCGSSGNIYTNVTGQGGSCTGVGGLLGGCFETYTQDHTVVRCFSTVNITSVYEYASTATQVGGLVGNAANTRFEDCWAGGNLIIANPTGAYRPWFGESGGLFGVAGLEVGWPIRCFSYGRVEHPDSTWLGAQNLVTSKVGGFVGKETTSTFANCYWDTTTSTLTVGVQGANTTGVTGYATADMWKQATYVNYDFTDIWEINEGLGYPTLKWEREEGEFKRICVPV